MFNPNDNVEQQTACEILSQLISTDVAYIGGELFDLAQVTDSIDIEEMREAVQNQLEDSAAVRKLYINEIVRLVG